MSFNREVLPFRLTVSVIIALVCGAIITGTARRYSIPLTRQPEMTPNGFDGFYLGKAGGVVIIVLLLWCFGLFDKR
jgi:hypothetical protein